MTHSKGHDVVARDTNNDRQTANEMPETSSRTQADCQANESLALVHAPATVMQRITICLGCGQEFLSAADRPICENCKRLAQQIWTNGTD